MKGFFSQGLVVLCASAPSREDLAAALAAHDPQQQPPADTLWAGGTERLTLPGPGGATVLVDVVPQAWPDAMGDPQDDPDLFGAWSTGFLGPLTFPGSLARAVSQSYVWQAAPEVVPQHRAFVRLQVSYVSGPDAPVLPEGYDALSETRWLLPLWRSLLEVPGALCAFNPGGEVLADATSFDRAVAFASEAGIEPLDLWSNVRLFRVDDHWAVMDTVGMGQLDAPDHEACFSTRSHVAGDVALMLRNLAWYLVSQGPAVTHGDTLDGPGGRWRCLHAQQPLTDPPRPTLRWFALDGPTPPDALVP